MNAIVQQKNNVATPSNIVTAMRNRAKVIRTLLGGTEAMRRAGETYLPREPAESADAYDCRLKRSTLFNATGKTVADMTGKVFVKPVVLEKDVPDRIKELAEDIDAAGRSINVFARDVFFDALQPGVGFIFVDMPKADVGQKRTLTVAETKSAGLRPYLIYIPIESALGWKSEMINGVQTLTQFRFLETVTEKDGPWHEKEIEQVRVIERDRYEVYRVNQNDPKEWVMVEQGSLPLGKVPVVPIYLNRTGFMVGLPPLEKLAELNITHWQSGSDQRNILHVARVPILFGAGITSEDKFVVGASSMFRCNNAEAKLEYVEHSGQAIEAGRNDLKDLEFQMQTMGLQLLVPNPGQSATGEVRDDAKENSPLAMMVEGEKDALEAALGLMAEYLSIGEGGGSITLNKDFGILAGAGDLQLLLNAVTSGKLSSETFWFEMQRRNILSDSFDPKVEKDRLLAEAPELDSNNPLDLSGGNEDK